VTAAGFLTGRVKGGSARESVVDVEGVLMLPESIQRRLDSIRNLSRQGKRINGLFRRMCCNFENGDMASGRWN
jgi:hypothetical protein